MAEADGIPLTKACRKCGEHKPLTREFWTPQKAGKYGFTARCRACANAAAAERRARPDQQERQQAWRDANKAKVKAYNQEYRVAGYKSTEHVAAWRARNRERAREMDRLKQRRLRAKNPEKHRDSSRRSYYRDHAKTLARLRQYSSRRYRELPWFNLKAKIASRLRMMLSGVGGKGRRRTEDILGYKLEDLVAHIERQFTKGMSWAKVLDGSIEIDHIVPVAHFKPTSIHDSAFRACWAMTNLRPAWADDNRKKSAKVLTLL